MNSVIEKWVNQTLGSIRQSFKPRTWVEKEFLRSGSQFRYNGGLGDPLRGVNPIVELVVSRAMSVDKAFEYGPEGGLPETIQAVIDFSSDIDGIKFESDQVLINEMGSCALLNYLVVGMAQKDPDGKVNPFLDKKGKLHISIESPAYGRHVSSLPKRDVRYQLVDPFENGEDKFEQTLDAAVEHNNSKLIVISLAVNPTTQVKTAEQLKAAMRVAKAHGAVLYVDCAYGHVYRESLGPLPCVHTFPEAEGVMVVSSLSASKGWQSPNIGGILRGHPEPVRLARKVRNDRAEGGSIINQVILGAMLRCPEYLAETRQAYDSHLGQLAHEWGLAGWTEVKLSPATIFIETYLPAVLTELGWTARNFVTYLAHQGVILYPSEFFRGHKEQKVRICGRGTTDNIAAAAEVIKTLLEDPPPVDGCWPQV